MCPQLTIMMIIMGWDQQPLRLSNPDDRATNPNTTVNMCMLYRKLVERFPQKNKLNNFTFWLLIHLFDCFWFVQLAICLLTISCLFPCGLTHVDFDIHSFVHFSDSSSIHSFWFASLLSSSLIHSPTCPPHSLTHPPTHTLPSSLTHSLTRSPKWFSCAFGHGKSNIIL